VRVRVQPDEARVPAYTIPASHPAIAAATAALEAIYPGQQVLQASVPGTLPATTMFERLLGVKTLFFSFSTADEKLHAPNEYLRIRRLHEGMRAWEQLWRLLARAGSITDGGM
jgi:acetylornithine deacetylase/succinyl-diaminopimelate desuccinylase-like protein